MLDKPLLRSRLLEMRAGVDAATRATMPDALARHAAFIAETAGSGTVSGFWPIRDEADPRALMAALDAAGVGQALPVVTREGLVFKAWRPSDALVKAGFGLLQPLVEAPLEHPAVMLVPLLGFDRRGGRIGYGRGYYDGAIARYQPRRTIGIAFSAQEVPAVPLEPHDQRLDMVLTERELIDCRPASGK